ncbi:protein NUCLEOLAR COMPLEX ASSOCIATED [Trifolium repens]|nr:protein NUCLEOLAR COMPLEX ASSOCIATED [Trifolium repens]
MFSFIKGSSIFTLIVLIVLYKMEEECEIYRGGAHMAPILLAAIKLGMLSFCTDLQKCEISIEQKYFFGAGISLWEIDIARHHYCPPVSRSALSLETDLTVKAKTSDDNVGDFSVGNVDDFNVAN